MIYIVSKCKLGALKRYLMHTANAQDSLPCDILQRSA